MVALSLLFPRFDAVVLEEKINAAVHFIKEQFYYNSDLISSITYLALNTILFFSKLIKSIPEIIPKASYTLLSFAGVISLNMQARDWAKNVRDCRYALLFKSPWDFALTAARVCVKGTNILLTCATFAGAIITLLWSPAISLALIQVMRPVAVAALCGTISGEFIDYAANDSVLERLTAVQNQPDADKRIQAVARHFLPFAYQPAFESLDPRIAPDREFAAEQSLAMDVVRQMENWTLDSFKAGLAAQEIGRFTVLTPDQSENVFRGIVTALEQRQQMSTANIGLTALGYVSLGLCRAFPQTLVQYGLTWAMSLFYTGKLIFEKYLLKNLEDQLGQA